MTQEELIKFLKENLKIKIDWFDTSEISITLLLQEEKISQCSMECPRYEIREDDDY